VLAQVIQKTGEAKEWQHAHAIVKMESQKQVS